MIVLGISAYFHDSAAALVKDGVILAAAQEERFSRVKGDASFPHEAIRFCLSKGSVSLSEVDHIVFYEKPLKKFERILSGHLSAFPHGRLPFVQSMKKWLGGHLFLRTKISKELEVEPTRIEFIEHHLSHAASSFLVSPFKESAILTVDGVGEWCTTGIYHGRSDHRGTEINAVAELQYPNSLGLFYSALTAYLGFRVNRGEYKVMGLASFGEPRFENEFASLIRLDEDGSFELNPRYFCFDASLERGYTEELQTLLGPSRAPETRLDNFRDRETKRFADIAATLQLVTERAMLGLARAAKRQTGSETLCLAGGVALNSVANRVIAESGLFKSTFVQPAAGDAGGALGAALYISHVIEELPRAFDVPALTLLGEEVDPEQLAATLNALEIRPTSERPSRPAAGIRDAASLRKCEHSSPSEMIDDVAKRLTAGQVGAWVQGRFEWGPRALGSRSILADPRHGETAKRVNARVKYRELFRPFAPAALSDEANHYFELGGDEHLARYMLSVARVTPAGKSALPATTHIDGTARVQLVDEHSNPRFQALLKAFRDRTGVGVLLNTSLNLKGEPLCRSAEDALSTFMRSDLDFLAIENVVISKPQIPHLQAQSNPISAKPTQ